MIRWDRRRHKIPDSIERAKALAALPEPQGFLSAINIDCREDGRYRYPACPHEKAAQGDEIVGHKKCDTCYKTKHTTKFAFKRKSKELRDTCRTCVGRAAQGAGGGWGFRPGFVPDYKGRRYEDVRLKWMS